jgi:hypothetical protein
MIGGLAFPRLRLRARSRRRRLPRPPKFTRRQKCWLAWAGGTGLLFVIRFVTVGDVWALAMTCSAAATFHAVVMDALRRPLDSWRSLMLSLGLWLVGVVCKVLGV